METPYGPAPGGSALEALRAFLQAERDGLAGMADLAWQRYLAACWAEMQVAEMVNGARARALEEAA
ncbi:MAG TPA: hypothetical protein VN667_21545 [Burkholderiales bacterium]|nr:hypothetical protein [Burkholderiales bacterium]